MRGGSPTAFTTHSSGCSDENATVAPSESSVRSLSLDVTITDRFPSRRARWNIVSARMNSEDSM